MTSISKVRFLVALGLCCNVALILFAASILSPFPCRAQATATIAGSITDPSGAAIPGAAITVTNVQTGLTRTQESAADGTYTVPLLPVGEYRIEVQQPGFQSHVRDGLILTVSEALTVDIELEVGQLAESVTVSGAAPLVNTQTGTLQGLVDQQRMVELPLNGRTMTEFMRLQAGVIQTADRSNNSEGIAFSVNGSRSSGVYYTMDGGFNTNAYRNLSGKFPNPDAVQEFSVQRSNFSAEYANATGAVVNVVTKSGTNEFHGSAFWFVRNEVLNARNFFASDRDSLRRNQFGGAIGGPVIKNKLFFFGSYQGTRLRSDPRLGRQFLPTAAQRAGDFSAAGRPILDPASGQPFPDNQIPLSRFNPVTQAFLEFIPVPTAPDGFRPTGEPNIADINEYTMRGDLNLGKHRISSRYFRWYKEVPLNADPNDIAQPLTRRGRQPNNSFVANHMYTFSPTLLNEATFTYTSRARIDDWDDFEYPINYQIAGVKNIAIKDPAGFFLNVSGFFTARPTWPFVIQDNNQHIAEKVTWIRGNHELKFGGEWIRHNNRIRNDFRTMGIFDFNGSATDHAVADFMLGESFRFQQGGGEFKNLTGYRFGVFIQDRWRATRNLTLNFGLRWDPIWPFEDELGRVQCIRPGMQSTRFPNAPEGYLSAGDPSCPEGGFESDYQTIAPRFGFAWRPGGGKTVVRGGLGLFYNPLMTVLYNGFVNGPPFSPQVTVNGAALEDPYANRPNPFPGSFAPFDPPQDAEFFPPLGRVGTFDPNWKTNYNQIWNLTIEREVFRNLLGRISYVGNLARRLPYSVDTNYAVYIPGQSTVGNTQERRPLSQFGQNLTSRSQGTSSYHGMQLEVERRFSAFSFQVNYTWSKSIDEQSGGSTGGITPGQSGSLAIPFNRDLNRGLSEFDVSHRLVTSYVWTLPSLQGRPTAVRAILGDWQTSGIWTFQAGQPFSVASGRDNSFSGIGQDYADLTGQETTLNTGRSRSELIAEYFNTGAFQPNAIGTFGNAPRSLLRGPGLVNFDLAVMKIFPIKEQLRLQFRTELFNALNKPNFSNPFSTQRVSGRFGRIEGAADPRIIQFALKLLF